MRLIPISPLSLNQLTRDYWGQFDPAIIAQLAQLANDPCYSIKFYKSPADNQDVVAAFDYVTDGMKISPGSIIFGIYNPAVLNLAEPTLSSPGDFTVQITDVSLEHKWFDDPVAALMLSNLKPTYQDSETTNTGSFPNLLCAPYPVVGSGQFDNEFQETSGETQRIQLVFGVLEVCNAG